MTCDPPRACVIGHPIAHSRSPMIHGYWLRTLGLAGSYDRVDVPPGELAAFVADLRRGSHAGCNVTIPHKEAVLGLVDHITESARAIGAANTLWLEGGRLLADNTDAAGYLAHLDASVPDWWSGDPVVVLGAGGAARAIVHALLGRGVEHIRLLNRSRERAEALAAPHGARVAVSDWSARADVLAGAGLLINTTALGMKGQLPLDLPLDALPPNAIVSDIVYVPLVTLLLAAARARGLRTVDGLGMLLHQAVVGFEHWFGHRPRVTRDLWDLVAADIEGRRP